MNKVLQRAIDNLRIHDVYLRSTTAEIAKGFEPKYDANTNDLDVQFKHLVTKSDILALTGDHEEQQLFRVYIELGARWVQARDDEATVESEPVPKALIEGTMIAEYLMGEKPEDEALKAFALRNASYHVWPYWREYLSMQCLRMNLPKVTLPVLQFAANQNG